MNMDLGHFTFEEYITFVPELIISFRMKTKLNMSDTRWNVKEHPIPHNFNMRRMILTSISNVEQGPKQCQAWTLNTISVNRKQNEANWNEQSRHNNILMVKSRK